VTSIHTKITSHPFPIGVGRDHFFPLVTVLTHTTDTHRHIKFVIHACRFRVLLTCLSLKVAHFDKKWTQIVNFVTKGHKLSIWTQIIYDNLCVKNVLTHRQAEIFEGGFHEIHVLVEDLFQVPAALHYVPGYWTHKKITPFHFSFKNFFSLWPQQTFIEDRKNVSTATMLWMIDDNHPHIISVIVMTLRAQNRLSCIEDPIASKRLNIGFFWILFWRIPWHSQLYY
jgi:hypothetical protein